MFIKIAEIIGKGKNLKASLNKSAEIKSVKTAIKNPEVLFVAQELIFKAVLINTAVLGNPQIIHVQILDKASHNTSLFLSNFTFVIFSAILAEIIVSIIAIIATISEIVKSHFDKFTNSSKEFIDIFVKGISNKANLISGYLSTKRRIFGKYQYSTKSQSQIQIIVRTITPGNFGKFFLEIIKNNKPIIKIPSEYKFVLNIFFKVSIKFDNTSLCCVI
jgi:hypothetical protein